MLLFFSDQDQKAHEAILKVLNLDGFVWQPYYFSLIHFRYFLYGVFPASMPGLNSLYTVCSEARTPALPEWTSRADLCDKLTDPVGSCHYQI